MRRSNGSGGPFSHHCRIPPRCGQGGSASLARLEQPAASTRAAPVALGYYLPVKTRVRPTVATNLHNPSVTVTPTLKISYATDLFQPKVPDLVPVYVLEEQNAVAQAETRLAYDVTSAFLTVLKRRQEAELVTAEREIAELKRARLRRKNRQRIFSVPRAIWRMPTRA